MAHYIANLRVNTHPLQEWGNVPTFISQRITVNVEVIRYWAMSMEYGSPPEKDIMKERNSNKANHSAAIERRKQKQAAQQKHSNGKSYEPVFSDAPNKDTFGPEKLSHITGNGLRGNNRQPPLGNYGAS